MREGFRSSIAFFRDSLFFLSVVIVSWSFFSPFICGGGGGHSCLRGLDFNEQNVLPVDLFGSLVLFGRQLLFLQSTALFQHNTFGHTLVKSSSLIISEFFRILFTFKKKSLNTTCICKRKCLEGEFFVILKEIDWIQQSLLDTRAFKTVLPKYFAVSLVI